MGGWKYVVFWLAISLVCGAWLLQKSNYDKKSMAIHVETNNKLDKIMELLKKMSEKQIWGMIILASLFITAFMQFIFVPWFNKLFK